MHEGSPSPAGVRGRDHRLRPGRRARCQPVRGDRPVHAGHRPRSCARRLPRAVHIDHEMMRLFQSAGLSDELRARDARDPGASARRRGPWRDPLYRARRGGRKPLRLGERLFLLPARTRGACCAAGWRASRTPSCGSAPSSKRSSRTGGRDAAPALGETASSQVRARYVIGCDGARSAVRKRCSASRWTTSTSRSRGWWSMPRWMARSLSRLSGRARRRGSAAACR